MKSRVFDRAGSPMVPPQSVRKYRPSHVANARRGIRLPCSSRSGMCVSALTVVLPRHFTGWPFTVVLVGNIRIWRRSNKCFTRRAMGGNLSGTLKACGWMTMMCRRWQMMCRIDARRFASISCTRSKICNAPSIFIHHYWVLPLHRPRRERRSDSRTRTSNSKPGRSIHG